LASSRYPLRAIIHETEFHPGVGEPLETGVLTRPRRKPMLAKLLLCVLATDLLMATNASAQMLEAPRPLGLTCDDIFPSLTWERVGRRRGREPIHRALVCTRSGRTTKEKLRLISNQV